MDQITESYRENLRTNLLEILMNDDKLPIEIFREIPELKAILGVDHINERAKFYSLKHHPNFQIFKNSKGRYYFGKDVGFHVKKLIRIDCDPYKITRGLGKYLGVQWKFYKKKYCKELLKKLKNNE